MVTLEDETVALRIQEALEATGHKSVKHLAEESGIPRSTLTRKLKRGSFTVAELTAIAQSLGTSLGELIPHEIAA